jgi:ferric-dicitrate binding protein FerR (iron transport regulator)
MHSIQLSINDYLDGELTEHAAELLAKTLETDSAALDQFVMDHFIHSQLLDWMDPQHIQDRALIGIVDADDADVEPRKWSMAGGMNGRSNGLSSRRLTAPTDILRPRTMRAWGALAAALLIATSISVVSYVIGSRPVFVGTLTDATGCRWGSSPTPIEVGSFLEDGQQLDLLQGRAVITFASGAKVLLEGPSSVRLDSDKEVQLIDGRLAAKVPRQAIGFTVTSGLARFIDLGTAFTLNLVAEKSFELHVFEGMVEVRIDKRFGKMAQRPAYIAEVHAVSFDIKTGDVEKLHFQEGKQMPF